MSRRPFALCCLLIVSLLAAGCGDDSPTSATPPPLGIPFSITDLVVGTGNQALNGRRVSVYYTGWLYDPNAADFKGTQFDTTTDDDVPFAFLLGGGGVIQGWVQGLTGMRVGGVRRLIIPPELGYGILGNGGVIPGNATLIFEIELLSAF